MYGNFSPAFGLCVLCLHLRESTCTSLFSCLPNVLTSSCAPKKKILKKCGNLQMLCVLKHGPGAKYLRIARGSFFVRQCIRTGTGKKKHLHVGEMNGCAGYVWLTRPPYLLGKGRGQQKPWQRWV